MPQIPIYQQTVPYYLLTSDALEFMSTSMLKEVLNLNIFLSPDLVEYRIYAEFLYNAAMVCSFIVGLGLFYAG